MRQDEQYKMPLYKLKKDIPLVKAGTIFYYDENDDILGSPGAGCLKLAWTQDNNCQSGLCADTIVFHANAIHDEEWFEKIPKIVKKSQGQKDGAQFKVGDTVQFIGYRHIKPFVGIVDRVDEDSVYLKTIFVKDGGLKISKGSALTFNQDGTLYDYEEMGRLLFRLNRNTWVSDDSEDQ